MIFVKLAIAAESIVRDAETNTVSIFKVLEEIATPGFPLVIPTMMVVFVLERDSDDADPQNPALVIWSGGEETSRTSISVQFKGKPRTRAFVRLNGLTVPGPGDLKFALEIAGSEKGAWSIPVKLVDDVQGVVQIEGAKE